MKVLLCLIGITEVNKIRESVTPFLDLSPGGIYVVQFPEFLEFIVKGVDSVVGAHDEKQSSLLRDRSWFVCINPSDFCLGYKPDLIVKRDERYLCRCSVVFQTRCRKNLLGRSIGCSRRWFSYRASSVLYAKGA